jgi:multidrug transporter EmrE-like cation transporter
MTGHLDGSMLALVAFCVLTEAGREVCFKFASINGGGNIFLRPATLVGVVFWGVEILASTYVLAHLPLSIAFPLMASSYAVIAVSGAVIFKEKLNARHSVGVALITGGVICVGVTGL